MGTRRSSDLSYSWESVWYADDAGALRKFTRLETYFHSLTLQDLGQGYHPEPSKSILIVSPENLEAGKVFGRRPIF